MRTGRLLALGVSLCAMAGNSYGDTVTGRYTPAFSRNVGLTVVGWNIGPSNNTTTFTYNWNREDLPPVPGVDLTLPEQFESYCVDLNESVAGNLSHTFQVVEGTAAGFSATQVLLFSRLWAGFQHLVVDQTTSSAFQAAVYEIVYDGNGTLSVTAGNCIVQVPDATRDLAATWLASVGNLANPLPTAPVVILSAPGRQDQLTVRIPSPGAAALGGIALTALAARRNRRGQTA